MGWMVTELSHGFSKFFFLSEFSHSFLFLMVFFHGFSIVSVPGYHWRFMLCERCTVKAPSSLKPCGSRGSRWEQRWDGPDLNHKWGFDGVFHGDLMGIQWDLTGKFTMDWAFDGIYTIFMGFNCELLVFSLGFIVLHGDFHGILRELNGFHSHGGTQKWMVHKGKSQSKMDDDWWYPYFRKPAYQTNIGCMSILMGDDGRIGILNHQTCEHNHGI